MSIPDHCKYCNRCIYVTRIAIFPKTDALKLNTMPRKEIQKNDSLRISQAAAILGVDASTVLRWIGKGYLKSTKYPSGSHRIDRAEVTRFLRESRHEAELPKREYRIMILDDDEFFGTVLKEVLETSGLPLDIKSNRDPLSALVEIGQFHPDLIIIDYRLGDVDGLTIVEKVRNNKEFNGIPIIVISGYMDEVMDQEQRGIAAFLKKPFKSADLRDTVIRCLQMETLSGVAP